MPSCCIGSRRGGRWPTFRRWTSCLRVVTGSMLSRRADRQCAAPAGALRPRRYWYFSTQRSPCWRRAPTWCRFCVEGSAGSADQRRQGRLAGRPQVQLSGSRDLEESDQAQGCLARGGHRRGVSREKRRHQRHQAPVTRCAGRFPGGANSHAVRSRCRSKRAVHESLDATRMVPDARPASRHVLPQTGTWRRRQGCLGRS